VDGAPSDLPDTTDALTSLITTFTTNGTWGGAAGVVDDVRVYNRTLSPHELRSLYSTNEYALRVAGPVAAASMPTPEILALQRPFAFAAWVYPHTVDGVAGVVGQLDNEVSHPSFN
jgi:hypothetical protein